MYKLLYAKGTCSMAVHTLLNELNVPYEAEKVELHGPNGKSPSLMAANPRGQVPVLIVDGTPILEGGAILTWLCDEHNSHLLPKTGLDRAKALQGLMFANSSLHPAYGAMFKLKAKNAGADDASMKETVERIQSLWDYVENSLKDGGYIAGPNVTVGDILLTVIANWSGASPIEIKFGPKTKTLLQNVSSRPSFQKVLQDEDVAYKAAA